MPKYTGTLLPQTNDPMEMQKAILDLLKKINELSDIALDPSGKAYVPIGFTYIRLPGTSVPSDLFLGTWSDVSSTYAGAFFRVSGGNASDFGSGLQGDAIRNITGTFGIRNKYRSLGMESSSGAFYGTNASNVQDSSGGGGSYYTTFNFDASIVVPTTTQSSTVGYVAGSENRPVNYTVQVWQRTA